MSHVPQSSPGSNGHGGQPLTGPVSVNFPGTRVPSQYANHPLIQDKYFFTLPVELLEDIVDVIGEDEFNGELLQMDRTLSRQSGDHTSEVGFCSGIPIRYNLLGLSPKASVLKYDVTAAMQLKLGWCFTPCGLDAVDNGFERIARDKEIARAYCGWLMLNKDFMSEHNAFVSRWNLIGLRFGLDARTAKPKASRLIKRAATYNEFIAERKILLSRWHLTALATPSLPNPPMRHAPLTGDFIEHLPDPQLGTLSFFPTIFPPTNIEEMLHIVLDAMRLRPPPPHLAEWMNLTASRNKNRGKHISQLSRTFVLQHFWRVLISRHASACNGRLGKLHTVFGAFLFSDTNPPKNAARFVKERLIDLAKARGQQGDLIVNP